MVFLLKQGIKQLLITRFSLQSSEAGKDASQSWLCSELITVASKATYCGSQLRVK